MGTWVDKLKLEDKLALLSISHRFLFDKIFECVNNTITPADIAVVERIRLGDKYRLQEWLFSAYESLLNQPAESLSVEEIDTLGSERVACLLKAKCFRYQELLDIAQGKIGCSERPSPWAREKRRSINSEPTPGPAATSSRVVVEKYFQRLK